MKRLGWGNLRINFQTLLIALIFAHVSSSFAVANSINPTDLNIPTAQATTRTYTENTEIPRLNKATESRTYNFVSNENAIINENLGTTGAGSFAINGTSERNVIDMNGYSGFYVTSDDTTLKVSNTIITNSNSTIGSVLTNQSKDSSITLSNTTIESNSTQSQTTDALGGAIYTKGDIVLKNTSLIGNSATTQNSSANARGGAIYSEGSVEMIADSDNVIIVDNSTAIGSTSDDNAIYMNSTSASNTLSLTAKNNGQFYVYDNIKGSNYDLLLNGDGTGQIGLFNSINGANSINMSNVVISLSDGKVTDYTFNNLTIGENVNFLLDADLTNSTVDNITGSNSNGELCVSGLNFISGTSAHSVKLQVLKNTGLTLNIDQLNKKLVSQVQSTMYNDSILASSISLGTTSTTNDSIVITEWKDVLAEMIKDTDYTHTLKSFIFRTNMEYTLTEDLEDIPQETILAISNNSTGEYGVLNANGHSLFKLSNPVSKVSLDNILIKNANTTGKGSVASLDNNTAIFTATNSVISNNHSDGSGGAFYVKNGTLTVKNSTLENNSTNGDGGAIYNEGNVEIIADNGNTTIKNNTANGENNGIYVGSSEGVVNLTAQNNGVINLDDKISGTKDGYLVTVNGDSTGNVKVNNNIENATIQINSGVLSPEVESYLDGNNFVGNGGLLNLANGSTGTVSFNEVTITGNTNIAIDADLQNSSVDRITSTVLNSSTGKLNISNINVLSDSVPTRVIVSFAEGGIQSAIRNTVKTVYGPIYKYTVTYNSNSGLLIFNRGGSDNSGGGGDNSGGGTADMYNPAVLAVGVAQQVAYANQLQNYQTAMYHSDAYMMLPVSTKWEKNRLGSIDIDENFRNCSYQSPIQDEIRSIWVRPYSTFESIPLKRGVSVSNISYGTIFGGDSDLIKLGHGFSFVYGGYVGYNGNTVSYSHIDANQQGAVLGLTANIYKGKFFNTITANCGWNINETYNVTGTDTMNIIMSGVADRIGYNIETAGGKFIIQPSIFAGYTFVYTSDYTMGNGVRIKSDPLNVIHFAPTLKFIGNLEKGWQPYAMISVMANFMDKTQFTANNIKLPQMSIDPYVEYGLGIQRRWNENCQAFGQATVRNGGRRGVALLFGMKCKIGKANTVVPVIPKDRITDKKVKFKDRKPLDIEILDWKTAKKKAKQERVADGGAFVAKTSLLDKIKGIKKFIKFRYNTDVSAKVVSDVYPDGVIITTLKGQEQGKSTYSDFVDMDRYNKEEVKPVPVQEVAPEGIIIIEDTAFAHKQQVVQKEKVEQPQTNKVEQTPVKPVNTTVVQPLRKSDLIKSINKKYANLFKLNQTNYYVPEKKYEFSDYGLEIIKF